MIGEYELYFYDRIVNIDKSEKLLTMLEVGSNNNTKIEIMLQTRGAIHIYGSDMIDLYKKVKRSSGVTKIAVGDDNVEKIELYIPDNDLELFFTAEKD